MKDGEVKNKLSPAQVSVMRHKVTEPPYFGKYWDHFEAGTYSCAACDTVLFGSSDKFDSKSGWPTFKKPLNEKNLEFKGDSGPDDKIELRCRKCKSHLGYVVSGETPYYRINSVCLNFEEEAIPEIELPEKESQEDADGKKKDAVPVRPEFPLPPPAIALIEDVPSSGWSMSSILAGVLIGLVIGASGALWYSGRPDSSATDTATTTPETATTTLETPPDTSEASGTEPVAPTPVVRPSVSEPQAELATPADTQNTDAGTTDTATGTQ